MHIYIHTYVYVYKHICISTYIRARHDLHGRVSAPLEFEPFFVPFVERFLDGIERDQPVHQHQAVAGRVEARVVRAHLQGGALVHLLTNSRTDSLTDLFTS